MGSTFCLYSPHQRRNARTSGPQSARFSVRFVRKVAPSHADIPAADTSVSGTPSAYIRGRPSEHSHIRQSKLDLLLATMPNEIRDIRTVDDQSFPYIFEKNVTIPLRSSSGLIRANIYRPKDSSAKPVPVLMTYGPYGKDIYYLECVHFVVFL